MVGVVRRPGRRGGGSGGGGEVFARPPGEVAAGASRRTVHRRRVPCDVGDHAGAHDVVAQLGHVHEHVLRRSRLHDLLELTGDRRGRHRVRGLLAQVATEVGQVVVHAVLPAPAIGREAAHVTVVVVGPHDDHVVRQPERLRIAAVQVQHLRVHGEVKDRCAPRRQRIAHHGGLQADHLTEHARLVVVCGPLGPGIGAIRRVPQSHRQDDVQVMILRDAAAPEGQQAVAVREPVVIGSHAALGGEVECDQAKGVGYEDVVVVRRVVEAPVARELLDLEAAMHPHVRRHHVHPQPQRGFEVAPIPGERHVAGLEGVPAGIERPGQDVFVVVEEPAISEGGRSLGEARGLEHEGIVVLRDVARPEIEGIDAEALREGIGGERRAARVRPDQPDGGGCGDHPVVLPLPAQRGHVDRARERAVPDRDQPDARLAGAGRRHDQRAVAADRLDVAREERRGLAHIEVLRGADHDLGAARAGGKQNVAWRRGSHADPRPSQRRTPGIRLSRLRGRATRHQTVRRQEQSEGSRKDSHKIILSLVRSERNPAPEETMSSCSFRLAVLFAATVTTSAAAQTFERRAADLVGRMTLEEKVSQMMDRAPAIERLGIPEYNWWNEGLHGVARSGLATVFPQAIGFAATWNDSLVLRMATVISDEFRAKHHAYVRQGEHQRYQGLTVWSPNINLFRDPRWGRGQETYGEDPYLTGRLAVQFIRGLQGDDPRYLKAVATVKHFAVHSGPEPERHEFDAQVSERDLRESYLPHFEMAIREGGAYSLMCAYNRVYGKPACGSDLLLEQILRGEWHFPGYVVSDCGAIGDMYLRHKVVPTAAAAAALGVHTGTDLDCGNEYASLIDAVHQGLITEQQIDTSLIRLFVARFRLGMFDPPKQVRWARIPITVLDDSSHRVLARQVARESMVLLKNAGHLLPLRRDLGTIAVIGPNADQWRMLLGNYNGIPADPVTPLRGIREAVSPRTRVLYALGSDLAEGFPVLASVPSSVFTPGRGRRGLDVAYFSSRTMLGEPLYRGVDTTLDANWGAGAPRADMNGDDFGVRWTATFQPPVTGTYRLALVGTVKFQLYLDDSLLVRSVYPTHDGEFPDPRFAESEPLRLEAGRRYRLRVDGEESYGEAELQLLWATPTEALESEAADAARRADVVVLCLGLTARLEGEEMRVAIEGFAGGDRTRLDLPAPQQHLLERIVALGKPTVLVLMSGSAVAINWAQDHVPAILEAWYPGQAGGTAIAEVLFGAYNPGGRLPVTFYRDVADLPPFEDYRMAGRTYRFFEGVPLYPFGYGLSYTTFRYDRLRVSRDTLRGDDSLTVAVDVTNTGARGGDEVVQLYVRYPHSAVPRPRRDLRGFRGGTVGPGASRTITFPLRAAAFRYWDADAHRWAVENGPVVVEIGASSGDIRLERGVAVAGQRQP